MKEIQCAVKEEEEEQGEVVRGGCGGAEGKGLY